jgi:hypothetical protein
VLSLSNSHTKVKKFFIAFEPTTRSECGRWFIDRGAEHPNEVGILKFSRGLVALESRNIESARIAAEFGCLGIEFLAKLGGGYL